LNHLRGIGSIEDYHSCNKYDRHETNFTVMQPAHMDMRSHTIGKFKIKVRSVFNSWLEMGMRLYFDLLRLFAQQVKENRYIMRSKVPDHIDIVAKKSQVHAFSFDAVDFSEFTALYKLAQFINSGAVFKGMSHHQD